MLDPKGQGPGPEQEVEAALQFLRAAPDDGDARRRATQALERALKQLQGSVRSGRSKAPPANVPATR